ncbi:hypothetical protein [Streptomyces sp. NBC_01589]|uniref:hypothetical protein n=1 Tax=unclassified Streptomyces TaxID=2593676 RepID=UPI00386404C8
MTSAISVRAGVDDHRFTQTQFGAELALGPVAQLRVDQIGEPRHPGDGPVAQRGQMRAGVAHRR